MQLHGIVFHDSKGEIKCITVLALRTEYLDRNEFEDILETHLLLVVSIFCPFTPKRLIIFADFKKVVVVSLLIKNRGIRILFLHL